jgi:hypothetical protein
MTNRKLICKHDIPIEIFSECDVSLEVLINDDPFFKKTYKQDHKHSEVIQFEKEYTDVKKNKISFLFSGEKEVEKKYLKINQVCLNNQILNKYNSEYLPDINPEWWNNLTEQEQEHYNETMYGLTGCYYGWYGEINLYYGVGFDASSRFKFESSSKDYSRIIGEKIDWIYLDEDSVKLHTLSDNKIKTQ